MVRVTAHNYLKGLQAIRHPIHSVKPKMGGIEKSLLVRRVAVGVWLYGVVGRFVRRLTLDETSAADVKRLKTEIILFFYLITSNTAAHT